MRELNKVNLSELQKTVLQSHFNSEWDEKFGANRWCFGVSSDGHVVIVDDYGYIQKTYIYKISKSAAYKRAKELNEQKAAISLMCTYPSKAAYCRDS